MHTKMWTIFLLIGAAKAAPITVSDAEMTWVEAQSWCESQDLQMLSIHNDEEQTAAEAACPTTNNCWLGLYCDENAQSHCKNTDDWQWADGSTFGYANWKPGQPNNHKGRQDCVWMKGGDSWLWVDFECDRTGRVALAMCYDSSVPTPLPTQPTAAPTLPTAAPTQPTAAPTDVCVAYAAHTHYWQYGDCGDSRTPNSAEECCEAALLAHATNPRIDRWSYDKRNGGRCYFKCPENAWLDGDSWAEYPGFTEEDTTAFLSSADGALPGCGCPRIMGSAEGKHGASDVSVLQSGEARTVSAEQSVAESAGSESSFSLQLVIGLAAFGMGAISVMALLALKKRVQQKAAMKPAQEEHVPEVSVSAVPETTTNGQEVAIEMEAKQETV